MTSCCPASWGPGAACWPSQTMCATGLVLSTSLPGCGHFAAQHVEAMLCHRLHPRGARLGVPDSRAIPAPQGLLVYMFFLLVTLLANYGDTSCHNHAYRLQSAIKQELDSQAFLAITRYGCPVCRHRSVLWTRAVPMPARVHLNPALGAAQPLGGVGKRLSPSLVIRSGVGAVGHEERTQDRPSTALPAPSVRKPKPCLLPWAALATSRWPGWDWGGSAPWASHPGGLGREGRPCD